MLTVMYKASTWECRLGSDGIAQYPFTEADKDATLKADQSLQETFATQHLNKRDEKVPYAHFPSDKVRRGPLYEGAALYIPI